MTVVVLTWELHIPGCRSLKEKRMVVRSLRDRLRHRFNLSVAETGLQDVHDRAELTQPSWPPTVARPSRWPGRWTDSSTTMAGRW
jgi:hypothetical protein